MKKLYTITFIIICLIPLVTMFVRDETIAREDKVPRPNFYGAEGINKNYFIDLNNWFEKNYGSRDIMIELHNSLAENIFSAAPSGDVILGKEDWLFYKHTLNDYMATNVLSDEIINATADFIKELQDYCEERGVKFVFTIAPNKSNIYSEYMPYYYIKSSKTNNRKKLEKAIAERGVNYADLFTVMNNEKDEILYLKHDTHWNRLGALKAYHEIMNALELESIDFAAENYEYTLSVLGDLYHMYHPLGKELSEEVTFNHNFTYTSSTENNTLNDISTENPSKEGSIIMYRDSFGDTILPLMADTFGKTHFLKTNPIDLGLIESDDADIFILEIVERNIPTLLEYKPE